MVNAIRKINSFIATIEKFSLVVIILFMVFASFLQLILRNFFHIAITGGDVFLRHLVLWITFLGASLATKDNKNITIELLSNISNKFLNNLFHTLTLIFAMSVSAILSWSGWQFVASEIDAHTVLFSSVQAWWLEIIIPFGFAMISLRFFLLLLFFLLEKVKHIR